MDANVATSFRSNGNGYGPRGGGVSHTQLPLPLAHSGEHGEVCLCGGSPWSRFWRLACYVVGQAVLGGGVVRCWLSGLWIGL